MLTDMKIRQRKTPGKISDGGGLYLLIAPTGSKLWRQNFRFGGKQKTLSHGAYPEVTLQEARSKREAAKAQLRSGIDPATQRKQPQPVANTFREVAEEVMTKRKNERRSEKTLVKTRWLLDLMYPDIGDLPIKSITPPMLLATLRKIEGRGHYETANRARSLAGMVFRYAVGTGQAERDPSQDLKGVLTVGKTKHHAAITKPEEVGALLRAIDGYNGRHPVVRLALQLVALTFVRSAELRHAEWSETNGTEWRIPAHRMKMKVEHRVPLSRQALAIIEELRAITGHGRYLFPAIHKSGRPISEMTLNGALQRLGYSHDEHVTHGFRTTASTLLNEMGVDSDLIELQLAHQERNAVRRAYNRAERLPERVTMMQAWADYLDSLRAAI
jgi:integrase